MDSIPPNPPDRDASDDSTHVFDLLSSVIGAKNKSTNPPRFERRKLMGQGGLGRVWLAFDNRLEREVALKEMLPDKASNMHARRRFFREARIASKLRHPAIISIHDVEDDPVGDPPFFTMPVAPGGTLERSIAGYHADQRDPFTKRGLRRLLQIFVAICQAIDYAHSHGVIHRDLKPANIALGEFGEVLVLDWGLARVITQPDEADSAFAAASGASWNTSLTLDGDVVGTPAYMAPEQALGQRDAVTFRCDVYSLGAILFHILTNETPHQRNTCSPADFFTRIAQQPAPLARTIAPKVPRALEAICAKALAVNPQDRYATAGELATDVSRCVAGDAVAVAPDPPLMRVVRWFARHRTIAQLLSGTAALLLIAGVTIGVSVWTTFREMVNDHVREQSQFAAQVAARVTDFSLLQRLGVEYLADKPDIRRLLTTHAKHQRFPEDEFNDLTEDIIVLMSSRPYWTGIFLCDKEGKVVTGVCRAEPGFGPVKPTMDDDARFLPFVQRATSLPRGSVHLISPQSPGNELVEDSMKRPVQWYCAGINHTDTSEPVGAVIVASGIFSPDRPLYDFADNRPKLAAHVYLADASGSLVVQPASKESWHENWLSPGIVLRRYPELAPMFGPESLQTSMAVSRTSTNEIANAAQSTFNPFDHSQRIIVVVVSAYDDLKSQEENAFVGLWPPVAAATFCIVTIAFFFGWLVTRSAEM